MSKRSGVSARLVRTVSACAVASGLALAPMAANAASSLADRFDHGSEASAKVYYKVPFGAADKSSDAYKAPGAGLALDWSAPGATGPAAFDFRMGNDQPLMFVRGMDTRQFSDRLNADGDGSFWTFTNIGLSALALGVAVYLIIDATDDDDDDAAADGGGGGTTGTPLDAALDPVAAAAP